MFQEIIAAHLNPSGGARSTHFGEFLCVHEGCARAMPAAGFPARPKRSRQEFWRLSASPSSRNGRVGIWEPAELLERQEFWQQL